MKSSFKEVIASISVVVVVICIIAIIGLAGSVDVDKMTINECIKKMLVVAVIMAIAVFSLVKCCKEKNDYE